MSDPWGRAFRRAALAVATTAALVVGGTAHDRTTSARAEDPPPATALTQTIESSEKGEAVATFPAAWKIEKQPCTDREAMKLEIGPGPSAETARVRIFSFDGIRNARGSLISQLPTHVKDHPPRAQFVGHEPVEHFWLESAAEPHERHLVAIRHAHRRALVFVCRIPAALWDACYAPLLDAVRTADTRLADCVERPTGYKAMERDGYLYLLHPAAKKDDVAAFHARVLDVERDYAKDHGPVPKPKDNPIEIWFHGSQAAAEALITARYVKGYSQASIYTDSGPGVLIAWNVPPDSTIGQADLRHALVGLFHEQCFDVSPAWMIAMEEYGAWLHGLCGQPLPFVPGLAQSALEAPKPFADFVKLSFGIAQQEHASMLAYLALFRCGPKPYREAWGAFLAEMRKTGDWHTGEKILLALDQEKLAKDAAAFVQKGLKAAKAK